MEEKRHDGRTDPRHDQSPPGLAAVRRLIDGRHHRPGDEAHFPHLPALDGQLRSLALTLVDEYGRSDADKAVAQSFIKMSEVSLTIDCTALPQGTQLTVPEKVIKSAK